MSDTPMYSRLTYYHPRRHPAAMHNPAWSKAWRPSDVGLADGNPAVLAVKIEHSITGEARYWLQNERTGRLNRSTRNAFERAISVMFGVEIPA